MNVALYIRRSTIDLQPDSLAAQEELLRAHATVHAHKVVRIYSDSASGKSTEKRDAFQRLIDDVKRGPDFAAVLVRDVSRWSRAENTDEAGFYEFICRTNGVQVLYVDESFGPEQSPYALLMKSVKRAMAAEFSLEKARNVRASHARLVRQGLWPTGSVPYALKRVLVDDDGLLHCGTCSRPMDCKSGTSAKGKTYFYYRCRECGLNVPAAEIEKVVVQRIREIVRDKKILSKLVDETNLQLQEELPQLQERRTALERDLTEVKRQVGSFLSKLVDLKGSEALGPVKEKLEDLTRQRTGFESGLDELDSTIASVKRKAVNQETVLAALNRFKDIYAKLPPYQRRELIGLVLLKAEVTENQLRLSFHGRPAAPEVFEKISAPGATAPRRAEPFEWLRTRSAGRTGLWSESENFK